MVVKAHRHLLAGIGGILRCSAALCSPYCLKSIALPKNLSVHEQLLEAVVGGSKSFRINEHSKLILQLVVPKYDWRGKNTYFRSIFSMFVASNNDCVSSLRSLIDRITQENTLPCCSASSIQPVMVLKKRALRIRVQEEGRGSMH